VVPSSWRTTQRPDERFRAQREIVAIDAPVAVVRVAVDYDDGAAVA
jgi:hypothetical protein